MKYVLPILMLLVVPVVLASEALPYVQDGVIVSTVVLGDDAPPTDALLGVQIGAYLQRFASETRTGLAEVSSRVDLGDGGIYVVVGTPENNPLVLEALDVPSDTTFSGAYVWKEGALTVLTGNTEEEVAEAVALFTQGSRAYGVITSEEAIAEDVLDDAVDVPEVIDVPEDAAVDMDDGRDADDSDDVVPVPVRQETCAEEVFCAGNVVRQRASDCSEASVERCSDGCRDGACVVSQNFWRRVLDFFVFWN